LVKTNVAVNFKFPYPLVFNDNCKFPEYNGVEQKLQKCGMYGPINSLINPLSLIVSGYW